MLKIDLITINFQHRRMLFI